MTDEAERREMLRRAYRFEEWGPRPAPEAPFVWNFFWPAAAAQEWRVMEALTPETAGDRRARRYMLEVAGGPAAAGCGPGATATGVEARAPVAGAAAAPGAEALDLRCYECPSWGDAREAVLDYIDTCAGPRFLPGAELKYDFGEVSWGGRSGPGGTAFFVRGNMFVVVRRALGQPRVEGLARRVDQLLSQRPGEGDRGGKVPPEFVRLEVRPSPAGKRLELAMEARDPLDRPVWYQVFVRGGELARAENRLLLATTAGEAQVEAFAFNENGHWARRVLQVRG